MPLHAVEDDRLGSASRKPSWADSVEGPAVAVAAVEVQRPLVCPLSPLVVYVDAVWEPISNLIWPLDGGRARRSALAQEEALWPGAFHDGVASILDCSHHPSRI